MKRSELLTIDDEELSLRGFGVETYYGPIRTDADRLALIIGNTLFPVINNNLAAACLRRGHIANPLAICADNDAFNRTKWRPSHSLVHYRRWFIVLVASRHINAARTIVT